VTRSEELFVRAGTVIPGGVNSPVRAFGAVGGTPRFVDHGEGAYVIDVDGNRYVDLVGSWGALLFGHAHPEIVGAACAAAARGTTFGAPTEGEVELAGRIVDALPGVELVRLVSSGTEATMSAVRLARAATGRDKFLKLEGCYHGHADPFLIAAGSGAATIGVPSSPGVPGAVTADTLLAPYNDLAAVERHFAERGHEIAAIIVEPIAGNMSLVPPAPGFLAGLRALCDRHGSLLILDEVMTGFRVAWGGAQNILDIRPDLTTLGKVIGGGLPLGAFGGRRDIMEKIAPLGPVYQAGTLSGNPVAVAAGLATLKIVGLKGFHEKVEATTRQLVERLAAEGGKGFSAQSIGSMFGVYFREKAPTSFAEVMQCDRERFNRFFHAMLTHGVYLAPSAYEAGFVSAAHGAPEIDATLAAARASFKQI